MLVLTRRVGETLVIGEDVLLTILDVRGSQARIGITAPKSVAVNRGEVQERIERERSTRAGDTPSG